MGRFIVQDRAGRRSVPTRRQMTIGRGEQNDLVLDAALASRRHAWAWRQGDRVIVEDLGSTHGTWVNGEKIAAPRFLNDRDVLQMGEAYLQYMTDQPPSTVDTPPPQSAPRFDYPIFCPQCGAGNQQDAAYCFRCRYPLPAKEWAANAGGGRGLPTAGQGPRGTGGWQPERVTAPARPLTPIEPPLMRPFPTMSGARESRRHQMRVWILLLAIVALLLLVIVGVLAIYVLVLLEGG